MLLNVAVFVWFGAVCPWVSFLQNDIIPIYRLIFLGVLILLFRRLPVVFAMHWKIRQIEEVQQALFVGFFGPIGVSAVFYLYVSLEFLQTITSDGQVRDDAHRLGEIMMVVIWFLAICSIVVHGLSVPLGKVGYHLPRTISSAIASRDVDEPEPFHIRGRSESRSQLRFRQGRATPQPQVFRIGGSVIPENSQEVPDLSVRPERSEATGSQIDALRAGKK
jgi:sodium/hydrogen antiporter